MFYKFTRIFFVAAFVFLAVFASGQENVEEASVAPFGKVLFNVYGNLGSVDAQRRASIIEDNIKYIKRELNYEPSNFKIVQDDGIYNIMYGPRVIMGVTDKQAQLTGKDKATLAADYMQTIEESILKARRASLWMSVLTHTLLATLILGLTFFAVKYTFVLYRYIKALIWKQKNKADQALNNELDLSKQAKMLLSFLNILKIIIVVAIIFACVLAFLSIFPITYKISLKIAAIIIGPLKTAGLAIWNYLPSLVMIVIIITLFRVATRVLNFIAARIENGSLKIQGFRPDWAHTTYHLVWIILFVFTVIFIFPFLPNSNSAVFKGISVFLGVLISLGSTSLINNLMSGLVITYMSPFRIGDRIRMGDNIGNVIEKTSLVTRIKTIKNEIITIPNSMIMTSNTVNYTASAEKYGLILHSFVTMGYDVAWQQVHELLLNAASKTPDILQTPAPFILQNMLDDYYVRYEINVYTDKADEMTNIYSNLNKNIQDVFNEAGIEIASPHIFAVRDGSTIYAPPQYRHGDGKVSIFEVALQQNKPASAPTDSKNA